jgi:acyl-CoA thioesterase I
MNLRIFYLLTILILTGFDAPKKTILFYGDSLTAGYGLDKEQAFPAIIERVINTTEDKYKVINAGLSGETTAGGLSRLNWILKEPVDIFVLELGANDGLRGLPLDQTENNLQTIIDKVKEQNPNVRVVIAGMMVPPNLGQQYTDEFKAIFPRLAKKNKASLIPFLLNGVAGKEDLNLTDGIHPNVEGHKIVADNVMMVLKPLLN